uniref:Uncharacterized protein n=1 Tax=Romanomermis culicivorax TaxID=13658 RepID=A0A915ID60_ROMCU
MTSSGTGLLDDLPDEKSKNRPFSDAGCPTPDVGRSMNLPLEGNIIKRKKMEIIKISQNRVSETAQS